MVCNLCQNYQLAIFKQVKMKRGRLYFVGHFRRMIIFCRVLLGGYLCNFGTN